LSYTDGGICLVGSDSSVLPINPAEWVNGAAAVAQIRQVLSPQIVVPMPPTDTTAVAIKMPATTGRQRDIPITRWIGLVVFVIIGLALLGFAGYGAATRIGTGPGVISLVIWGLIGFRYVRRLL
jgi:hypothetical protein